MGWRDLVDNIAGPAAVAGSVYGAIDTAGDIRDMGNTANTQLTNLGNTLNDNSAFQGYNVTTGLGQSTVGTDGSTTLGVGPNTAMQTGGAAAMQNGANGIQGAMGAMGQQPGMNQFAQQGASQLGGYQPGLQGQMGQNFNAANQFQQQSMQDTAGRESDIYNRMMSMQEPGLQKAQAAQQAREYAMGRGGVAGSQFGGTQEDAAMAQARAQAMNQASFGAMNQAQQEQMQQANISNMYGQQGNQAAQIGQQGANMMGQMGNQSQQIQNQNLMNQAQAGNMLGQLGQGNYANSFMPMEQQLNAMQAGYNNAGMAQTGQLTGAGYQGQMGAAGIEALINAQSQGGQIMGNLYDSLLDNMGSTSSAAGGSSGLLGMLGL